MPSHYIVPGVGQQFAPVVRRVVAIARQVGERVDIDKSMPTPRLLVGERTADQWHQANAARRAADRKTAAEIADQRAKSREDQAAASTRATASEGKTAAEPKPAAANGTSRKRSNKPASRSAKSSK